MFYFCFIIQLTTHYSFSFFFNDTATTEIYTLSLHDALPIYRPYDEDLQITPEAVDMARFDAGTVQVLDGHRAAPGQCRSEEHTSELQSHLNLVCRLLLEKKKKVKILINETQYN